MPMKSSPGTAPAQESSFGQHLRANANQRFEGYRGLGNDQNSVGGNQADVFVDLDHALHRPFRDDELTLHPLASRLPLLGRRLRSALGATRSRSRHILARRRRGRRLGFDLRGLVCHFFGAISFARFTYLPHPATVLNACRIPVCV
jgi:hypothetical protein